MRQFLDRLPLVIQAKAEPGAHQAVARGKEIGQLLDATLQHRRVVMRYHSFSSEREKGIHHRAVARRVRAGRALPDRVRAGILGRRGRSPSIGSSRCR